MDPKEKAFLAQYLGSRHGRIDVPIYGAWVCDEFKDGLPQPLEVKVHRAEVDFYKGIVEMPNITLSLDDVQRVADLIAMYREVL